MALSVWHTWTLVYKGRTPYETDQVSFLKRRLLLKKLLITKLTSILIFATCLQVSAKGFSQQITLKEKNVPLEKIFQQIKKQSGYVFWYEDKLLKKANLVKKIEVANAELEHVLVLLFKDQSLKYEIIGKTIVINEKEGGTENKEEFPDIIQDTVRNLMVCERW